MVYSSSSSVDDAAFRFNISANCGRCRGDEHDEIGECCGGGGGGGAWLSEYSSWYWCK